MRRVHFLLLGFLACVARYPVNAQSFTEFLDSLSRAPDSASATRLVNEFMSRQNAPIVEKNSVHFLYRGSAHAVAVPSEKNSWRPNDGMMKRVEGTDLFFRTESLPSNGRLEYKIWVDSSWMLDPLNQKTSPGGYGENSDVWMPGYKPTALGIDNPKTPHGSLDTLWIESAHLQRKHALFVYMPRLRPEGELLPYLLVTDGSDFLRFGKLHLMLDNLLAAKRISPLVAIFIDPKTALDVDSTNQRMWEYAASDAYLDFIEQEVLPAVGSRYPISKMKGNGTILGVSMGGLIATYASLKRPESFPTFAAQSPAYYQADRAVIRLADSLARATSRGYIQTGTLNDTQVEAKLVTAKLRGKGGTVRYEEYPEGHNWTNWKAHLPRILQYFFPRRP